LNFAENECDVFSGPVSVGLQIGLGAITNLSKSWITEQNAASLRRLQRIFGALCNHFSRCLFYAATPSTWLRSSVRNN
jgi:hypothetical protein